MRWGLRRKQPLVQVQKWWIKTQALRCSQWKPSSGMVRECASVWSQAITAPLTLTAPSVAKARSKQFKGRRDMKLADAQAAFLDGEFKKVGGASHSLKVELHSRSLPSLTCVCLSLSLVLLVSLA